MQLSFCQYLIKLKNKLKIEKYVSTCAAEPLGEFPYLYGHTLDIIN